MASLRVGVDANPLACLLTRAKLAPASAGIVAEVLHQLPMAKKIRPIRSLTAFTNGKVEWFSSSVIRDLERVLTWLNGMQLAAPELSVVAAALSATVRRFLSPAKAAGNFIGLRRRIALVSTYRFLIDLSAAFAIARASLRNQILATLKAKCISPMLDHLSMASRDLVEGSSMSS